MSAKVLQQRARDRRRLWRGCEAKVRYRDEHAAERARRYCERQRGAALRVYDCGACGGFHLSSQGERWRYASP